MKDYVFASSYLRVIEKWLLDATDIQRMIGEKEPKEVLKVLEDTNYAKEFKGLISKVSPEDYQKILEDDLSCAENLLESLVENKDLIELCLLPFDFHNLKLFFKEKFLKVNLKKFVSFTGSQNPEELRKAVFGKKEAKISLNFKEVIKKAQKAFQKRHDPFFIETYLDKEKYSLALFLAKKIKSKWILEYLKEEIDLLNLANIVRLFNLKKKEKIKEVLIEGGKIKWEIKSLLKFKDTQDFLLKIKNQFDLKIREFIDEYLKEKNLWKFMRNLKNFHREELKKSKFIIVGPEVIFAYFVARLNANRNLRIIMEGKLNGIKKEEIQQRVRIPF